MQSSNTRVSVGIPRRIIILQFRRHAANQRLFLAANSAGVLDETVEAASAAATVVILDGTATTFYARLKTISRQFFVEGWLEVAQHDIQIIQCCGQCVLGKYFMLREGIELDEVME